jgi:hypothetical protein
MTKNLQGRHWGGSRVNPMVSNTMQKWSVCVSKENVIGNQACPERGYRYTRAGPTWFKKCTTRDRSSLISARRRSTCVGFDGQQIRSSVLPHGRYRPADPMAAFLHSGSRRALWIYGSLFTRNEHIPGLRVQPQRGKERGPEACVSRQPRRVYPPNTSGR